MRAIALAGGYIARTIAPGEKTRAITMKVRACLTVQRYLAHKKHPYERGTPVSHAKPQVLREYLPLPEHRVSSKRASKRRPEVQVPVFCCKLVNFQRENNQSTRLSQSQDMRLAIGTPPGR